MSLDVGAGHPSVTRVRAPEVHRPGLSQAERWAGLLVASGRGEQASFELLAQETRGSLLFRAVRVLPDVRDADEVVYDSLLEAWCSASSYDPLRWAVSTWMGQIIIADHDGVRTGLLSLSDRQRQAVRLTYHEGLTSSQSATRLGVPVATMRSRLHDGFGRLRAVVNGPESPT
jgi:RNA polymerase sigma-70 factor (ECF subfamily)